jgi:hypothetical protein
MAAVSQKDSKEVQIFPGAYDERAQPTADPAD